VSEAVDLAGLLAFTERLARRAGTLLLEAQHAGDAATRHAEAEVKTSPTDLVTALDRASETLIVEAILAERPKDGVLGEEGGRRAGTSGLCWVIDPLDGTTNFVYGYGSFAVSIALTDAAGALVGVVHDPARQETFAAARGLGACRNGAPIPSVREPSPLAEALVGTGFAYKRPLRAAQAKLLGSLLPAVRDLRRGGSAALDLCSVACGRLDAYYEAGLEPWDRAAGLLIATEAGCVTRDIAGLVPERDTLVVAPAALFGPLLELLERAALGASGQAVP
jgi:myo-inositol-1(or 4)-monophosphatase